MIAVQSREQADAAFFTSARSSVPSLSVSNIRMGLMRREPAKAGRLPPDNVAIAKVNRIDHCRSLLPFLLPFSRTEVRRNAGFTRHRRGIALQMIIDRNSVNVNGDVASRFPIWTEVSCCRPQRCNQRDAFVIVRPIWVLIANTK